MPWLSLVIVVAAVGGITGCMIYLRLGWRDAAHCRSVDRLVIACTAAALIGFGLATWDCVSSGQCFTPQRSQLSQWNEMKLVSFDRRKIPVAP